MNWDGRAPASPVLAHEADVEFAPLQVFAGVAHDLVEGVLQEVVPAYDEPGTQTQSANSGLAGFILHILSGFQMRSGQKD